MSRLRPLLDLRILGHTSGAISLCDDDQKPRISTVSGIKLKQRNVKSIIEEGSSPVPLENLEMFEGTGIILLSFSSPMLSSLTAVFATLSSVFRSRSALQLENLALRHPVVGLDSIHLEQGPNRVVYEPKSKLVYVGYGGKDAGKDYGEVGIIDAQNNRVVGNIKVVAHPSELLLDKAGKTLFVFVSIANKLQTIDTRKREVLSTWPVTSQRPGDAAFDESTSRLFIGTRTPAEMIAMDSKSGKEITHLPTPESMDGVYFDGARKRVYVSGGRDLQIGFAYVYQQKDADHYETIGKIPTRDGAGTSFWSPELDRYYVAASANDKQEAAILVYAPQD